MKNGVPTETVSVQYTVNELSERPIPLKNVIYDKYMMNIVIVV